MIPILEANVRKNKHLAATVAAALAVATLAGTSAFAETRHRQETQRSGNARETVRRERSARAQESVRSDESRNSRRRETTERSEASRRPSNFRPEGESSRRATTSRGGETYRRNESSSRGRETYRRNESSSRGESYRRGDSRGGRNDSWRNDNNRSHGNNRGYSNRGSYGNSRPYYHRGPVTRYSRYGGGYRVWVGGAPYPFYVPLSHWRHDRFRVGLVINLGGYYRDGYYDYYDGYDYRATSRGDLRGVVESVDYRRDTFVVRNEASGSFVTVVARDRRARDVRPGDYVELSGSWTRGGVFSAYDVDYIDRDDRERY